MKIAFVHAGQGAQVAGMGKDLYDTYDIVKSRLDEAESIMGQPLLRAMFEDQALLDKTTYAQPAIYALSTAIRDLLASRGIVSEGSAGLSLGEYAAFYDVGAYGFETGMRVLIHRAFFMDQALKANEGGMIALRGDIAQAQALVDAVEGLHIANINSPQQIVLGGSRESIAKAIERAPDLGIRRVVPLATAGAFHTPLMKDACQPFQDYLRPVPIEKPSKPLYLNTTGKRHEGDLKPLMVRQIVESVRFAPMIETMIDDGFDVFIELSPGDTLSKLIKKINREVRTFHVEDCETLDALMKEMESHAI